MSLAMRASLKVPSEVLLSGDLPGDAIRTRKQADRYELDTYARACKDKKLPIAVASQSEDPFDDFLTASIHGYLDMMQHLRRTDPKILALLGGKDHYPWILLLQKAFCKTKDQECRDWIFDALTLEYSEEFVDAYDLLLTVCTNPNPRLVQQAIALLEHTQFSEDESLDGDNFREIHYNSISEEDADSLVLFFEFLKPKLDEAEYRLILHETTYFVDSIALLKIMIGIEDRSLLRKSVNSIRGSKIMKLYIETLDAQAQIELPDHPDAFIEYIELCKFQSVDPEDPLSDLQSPIYGDRLLTRLDFELHCEKTFTYAAKIGEPEFVRFYGWLETNGVSVDPKNIERLLQYALKTGNATLIEYLCEVRIHELLRIIHESFFPANKFFDKTSENQEQILNATKTLLEHECWKTSKTRMKACSLLAGKLGHNLQTNNEDLDLYLMVKAKAVNPYGPALETFDGIQFALENGLTVDLPQLFRRAVVHNRISMITFLGERLAENDVIQIIKSVGKIDKRTLNLLSARFSKHVEKLDKAIAKKKRLIHLFLDGDIIFVDPRKSIELYDNIYYGEEEIDQNYSARSLGLKPGDILTTSPHKWHK